MVGDPNFWRRFSVAVHLDDAAKVEQQQSAKRPGLKHSESWLESQRRKARHRTFLCWAFWLVLGIVVAGVVVGILILKARGILP